MASDIFLYRKDRRWQKVSKVQEVSLTGGQTAYASVSGNATTNVVTITGATLANGMLVAFTSITGGAGLSTGVAYYVIDASGATCKLSLTQGGAAIDFTTNITAGSVIVAIDEMRVWSGEYRDIFDSTNGPLQQAGSYTNGPDDNQNTTQVTASAAVTNTGGIVLLPQNPVTVATAGSTYNGRATNTGLFESVAGFSVSLSDELAHFPLRQTLLNRTFWKFDRGTSISPRYLYAEYMQGDQILDNPPETE